MSKEQSGTKQEDVETDVDTLAEGFRNIVEEGINLPKVGLIHNKENNSLIITKHDDKKKILAVVKLDSIGSTEEFYALIETLTQYYAKYFTIAGDDFLIVS